MKFGWFAVGFLGGILGIVLAWLVNVDKVSQIKSDAIKWSVIGLVVEIGIGIVFGLLIGGMITASMAGMVSALEYM